MAASLSNRTIEMIVAVSELSPGSSLLAVHPYLAEIGTQRASFCCRIDSDKDRRIIIHIPLIYPPTGLCLR